MLPPLISLLIGLNVLAFILPYIYNFSSRFGSSFETFQRMGWKNNVDIANGEYYRLFTSTFLHGDTFHLLFNMYSLYQIGPLVYQYFQAGRFGIIYLLSGIGGSLFSYFLNSSPSVGASGSIFGLIGALVALAVNKGDGSFLTQLIYIIVANFFIGFLPGSRIDNFGHLGGLVTGFMIAYIMLNVLGQKAF